MTTVAPAPPRPDDTTPSWRWRGFGVGLVIVAVVGGTVLRFVAPSPLWLDEALSVRIASLGFADMVEALRHDGHPILYYLLLGWWMELFGDSNGSARALSAVLSLGTVPVLWAIGRRRSETLATVAAIVAVTSPFLLRYGTEARMYALVAFLVAVAWLTAERAVVHPGTGRLAALAAATAALVHTHYWSFWLVGASLTMCLFAGWRSIVPRRTAIRVGSAISLGAATFMVWLGVFLDQLRSTGTPWADRARPAEITIEAMQALGGNARFEGELLGVFLVLLAVLGTFGFHRAGVLTLSFERGPQSAAAIVTALTLTIGGLVALVTSGAFEGRYTAVVVPFVLVLIARGLSLFPSRIGLAATGFVAIFGLAIGIDEARRDRTQAGEVAAAISGRAQPGDIVVFCPDQVGPATHRALETGDGTVELTTLAYPRGDGRLVDWADYAEVIDEAAPEAFVERATEAAAGNDIWMVAGLGYRSLDNRCETIIDLLDRTHRADRVLAPSTVFEPMLLTRYEALG